MRILLANSMAYPAIGGVENSLRYIGAELFAAGHQVMILSLQWRPEEPLLSEHEGIEIVRQPVTISRWPNRQNSRRVAGAAQAMPNLMESFEPETVWSRDAPMALGIRQGGFTGPLLQIFPTLARMNCLGSFLQTEGLPLRRRAMLLGLWPLAYQSATSIEKRLLPQCTPICFSENLRAQLLAAYPEQRAACLIIRPGVDSRRFSPESGAGYFDQLTARYGISADDRAVLYVGRLTTAKHLPMLMKAFASLTSPTKLVLVGQGPEEQRLRRLAAALKIENRLVFAGVQDELLPAFYAAARVCVLPTTVESFGQVYLESMACGTPAVGFAGNGRDVLTATAEILRDRLTGRVVNEVSAIALAGGIESILALGDEEYAEMSRQAREATRKNYSWRRFVSEALSISGDPSA